MNDVHETREFNYYKQGWTGSLNRPGLKNFAGPTKVKLFNIHITIEKMV